MYPTSKWTKGEVVGDYYELPVADLPTGAYGLRVVVYESTARGWHNLAIVDRAGRGIGEQAPLLDLTLGR